MANQVIGLGTVENDGTGDNLRVALDKVNDNFLEIYTLIGDASSLTSGISATATVVTLTAPTISGVVGGTITSATITTLTGTTFNAGTLALSAGSITDSSGAISFGNENLTTTGVVTAASLDISGNVDVDGTLETDALTIDGVSLSETIADTVGAMVSSNTETNITVTYDDADNTLDFVIGTLNQSTSGNAGTATALETARTIHGVSFDGTANIDLSEVVQDTVGAMFSNNTETNITATYQDADGTIDLVIGTLNQDTTGNAATATSLETARTIGGVSFDGSANINLPGVNSAGNQNTSGSAATLTTARTIGGTSFDGSANIDVALATLATTVTITDNESTDENNAIIFTAGGEIDGGNLGLESDGTLTYNPSTGKVTATGFVGTLTGNVTGNTSGTAATVTGAAQTNITSVGTLTALQVDNINIDGNAITSTAGVDLTITPLAGQQIVLDGAIVIDAGVVTGATSITSTAFVGDITGDVTGTADVATVATTVTITDNESTDENNAIIFTAGGDVDGGNLGLESDGTLTYNPSTGKVTATGFVGTLTGAVTGNADTATVLATARTIGGVSFNGSANIDLPGVNTAGNQNTSGSAATLTTARTIGGVSFNGSANIDLPGVNSAGNQNTSGSAATLTTARTIGGTSFDGSANIDVALATLATTVTITDNESTDENNALIFTAGGDIDGGNLGLESDGTLTYNPSTGKVTATGFVGTLTGNVTGDVTGNADTATALATARTIGGVSFDGSANINLPGVNSAGNQNTSGSAATLTTARTIGGTSFDGSANIDVALATLATTATVSDSNANTNFPVVFNDESNALLDDTGALRYNPSTGTLLVPNLVVAGTTTQVDTVTMEAANAIVFEGATANDHETTLTIIDPTADRTQRLINQSGYIPLLAALTTTAITSTPEELNILDGATVVVGEINALDLGSTAVGNAIASKAVILDSSKDYTGIRNLTISGEIDAATGDYSGAVDIAGATTTAAITASGIIKTDDTTAATSTTDGSLQTDGGLSVAADAVIGDDLFMLSDAAVITFGADKDVTLTHVADTGLLLNGTSVIQFNDASQNIGAPSATVLDINATDEIELNATLLDVNANINASGTYTGAGTMTTGGNIIIPNAGNIGSVGDTDSIAIASNGVVTFSQIPVMPANSIDSDEYIDGSIDREHLAADIIDGTKIADDAIDSEHYTDGSIDLAHMSANSVDSDQYVDGSIDLAHMSANSVDSDQYVDGSIDTVHIADNQITLAKMAGIARGKIIYGDASGDPAVLTAGSNTQVLTSDGTDISWADAGGGASAIDDLSDALTNSSGGTIGLGTGALANDDGSANLNTAVGFEALNDVTTGANNTAVGYQAGDTITTGTRNTILGSDTAATLTTGYGNTLLGYQSGTKITTGHNNIGIGYNALTGDKAFGPGNITGNYNTAISGNALKAISSGTQNIAIGNDSGYSITSGNNNIAIGFQTLYNNTTGAENVAIGDNAMYIGSAAYVHNVGVGSWALGRITGNGNTGVGADAAANATSGANNTFLGYLAGNTTTTSTNNTLLGYDAEASSATVSNEITLGNTSVTKFRIPGINFVIKDTTATEDYVLTVDASGEAGWEAAAGGAAADDITAGDSAVLLTTSSGNITIDAAASDSDIIFKGTDGGVDTTFATMDGSAAGHLILNNGSSTTTLGLRNYIAGLSAGAGILSGGNDNVLIGENAGTAITTGDNNVAIGSGALDANTAGKNNTAVGYNALTSVDHTGGFDGENNTAVGSNALQASTTANHNAAVGDSAMYTNTTGTLNVAMGTAALFANTSGTGNVAIGRWALFANTTACCNVAIGREALKTNTTSSNSTAIGYQALFNSTGINTALGYQAGYAVTTGSKNVLLGFSTAASAVDATNQVVIGDSIAGTANDQVSIGKLSNIVSNDFGTDAVWTRASDVRKKKNITDAVLGLGFINDLRPVTYQWKPNYEFPKDFAEYSEENHMTLDVTMHGLIAQEVKEALDKTGVERFAGWSEGADGCQRISAEAFVFPLIKAIQELTAKVTELEEKLNG
jgi:trimeric autotransporter adhesin